MPITVVQWGSRYWAAVHVFGTHGTSDIPKRMNFNQKMVLILEGLIKMNKMYGFCF